MKPETNPNRLGQSRAKAKHALAARKKSSGKFAPSAYSSSAFRRVKLTKLERLPRSDRNSGHGCEKRWEGELGKATVGCVWSWREDLMGSKRVVVGYERDEWRRR